MTKHNDARVDLHLPQAVKDWLIKEADEGMRSLNAHILFILKSHMTKAAGR
jgi:hypothetical protein